MHFMRSHCKCDDCRIARWFMRLLISGVVVLTVWLIAPTVFPALDYLEETGMRIMADVALSSMAAILLGFVGLIGCFLEAIVQNHYLPPS